MLFRSRATKDGAVTVKVSARDAAVIFAIMFDKRQLMLNQPTSISESRAISSTADEMVAAFRAATSKDITGQATSTIESAPGSGA